MAELAEIPKQLKAAKLLARKGDHQMLEYLIMSPIWEAEERFRDVLTRPS